LANVNNNLSNSLNSATASLQSQITSLDSATASLQSQVNTISNSIAIVSNPPSSYSIVAGQTVLYSGSWGSSVSSQTLIAMPPGWYQIWRNNCTLVNSTTDIGFALTTTNSSIASWSNVGGCAEGKGMIWGDGNTFMYFSTDGTRLVFQNITGYNFSNLIIGNTGLINGNSATFTGAWAVYFHRFI
ncbi:MAG: hypothetical protein QW575_07960, partial [Thermoproteota archaeon]